MQTQSAWDKRYIDNDLPWDTGRPDSNLQELVLHSGIAPCRALEIGCGTGTNAIWLARQGFSVRGVDLAEQAINRAKRKASAADLPIDFQVLDLLRESLPGAPYGLVLDRGCFHSFEALEDRTVCVNTVWQAMGDGGRWLSMIGSCDGPARTVGPPRRSLAEIARAVEAHFEILSVVVAFFDSDQPVPAQAWLVDMRKRPRATA